MVRQGQSPSILFCPHSPLGARCVPFVGELGLFHNAVSVTKKTRNGIEESKNKLDYMTVKRSPGPAHEDILGGGLKYFLFLPFFTPTWGDDPI